MSSDPLDSFVVTLYHSEIIEEVDKMLAKDLSKGVPQKYERYVAKLFKKVLRQLFSRC